MSAITPIPCENVEIDSNSLETTAARLVCSIKPRWALKKLVFKKLTNDSHLIYYLIFLKDTNDEQNSVILKLYPTNSDVYADQEEQFHLLSHLIQQKVAAHVLLRFNNGYICTPIPGKALDIKEQPIGELVARKLAEFHSIPSRFHGTRLADKLKQYIDLFTDKNKTLHDRLVTIQNQREKSINNTKNLFTSFKSVIGFHSIPTYPLTFAQLQTQLKDVSWMELSNDIDCIQSTLEKNGSLFDIPIVLCLNNLRLGNFRYDSTNHSIAIIDFDHCLHDYYLFDIVSFFLELSTDDYEKKYPERPIQKQFLADYLKNSTLNMSNSVYDHRKVAEYELEHLCDLCGLLIAPVHLYWALWAFLQALLTKPTNTFDYVNYGRIRLAQYYRHKSNFFLPMNQSRKPRPKF
ncbi:unnamed protein product [Adineta ricciae]|uniref:ethanolamine kinase n=1 Tax=Adineta ricciae TaxID=249248 RepID=A0A814CXY0_ADIRI|nr:unnamed protein product [Adineta ricciae]